VYTANSAKEHIQNVDIKRDLTVASQPIITRIRSIRASITTESAQIMRDIASVYALNVGNVNELNQWFILENLFSSVTFLNMRIALVFRFLVVLYHIWFEINMIS
jgi:hypothetical protein